MNPKPPPSRREHREGTHLHISQPPEAWIHFPHRCEQTHLPLEAETFLPYTKMFAQEITNTMLFLMVIEASAIIRTLLLISVVIF